MFDGARAVELASRSTVQDLRREFDREVHQIRVGRCRESGAARFDRFLSCPGWVTCANSRGGHGPYSRLRNATGEDEAGVVSQPRLNVSRAAGSGPTPDRYAPTNPQSRISVHPETTGAHRRSVPTRQHSHAKKSGGSRTGNKPRRSMPATAPRDSNITHH